MVNYLDIPMYRTFSFITQLLIFVIYGIIALKYLRL